MGPEIALLLLCSLRGVQSFQCGQAAQRTPRTIVSPMRSLQPALIAAPSTTVAGIPPLFQQVNEQVLNVAKYGMDAVYGNRSIDRFYALETAARMPYFAYFSVLHLYETLGWFRKTPYMRSHIEENWNELYHLKIMEQLGGGRRPLDRNLAHTASVGYFCLTVLLYVLSPATAYDLSRRVEEHAYASYDEFIEKNKGYLISHDVPPIALQYYNRSLHFTSRDLKKSNGPLPTLYDIFVRIRDDEKEHAGSMSKLEHEVIEGKL